MHLQQLAQRKKLVIPSLFVAMCAGVCYFVWNSSCAVGHISPDKRLVAVLDRITWTIDPKQYADFLRENVARIPSQYESLGLPAESIDPSDDVWLAPETALARYFCSYGYYADALFFVEHGLSTKREPRGLQLLAELAVILERPELLSNITPAERKELAWKYRAAEQISGGLHKQALATLEPILDTFPERQKTGDFEALSDWLWAWRMHVYAAVRSNNVLAFEKRYDQLYAWAMGEDPATVIRRLQDGELSSSSMFLFEHLGRICLRLYEGNRNQGNDETAEKWRRRGRKVTAAVGKANVLSLVARDYLLPKFEPDGAADAIPSD